MRTRIPGSPASWSEQELHDKAHEIVRSQLQQTCRQAHQEYEDAISTPLTSDSVKRIVLAADDGRVESLFTATSADRAGSYDAEPRLVNLQDDACDDDLIDVAARKTLQNGGNVFALDREDDVPGWAPMAATFRYALPSERLPALKS